MMTPPVPVRALLLLTLLLTYPLNSQAEVSALVTPPVGFTVSDQPVSFSSSTFDAASLIGGLEGGDEVLLQATAGALTLATTAGLDFSAGDGVGDAVMVFSGADADVDAALDGLSYEPPSGFAGEAELLLRVQGVSLVEASWRVAVHALLDADAARAELLAGVEEIHSGVQPGRMVAYGPEAYDAAWYPGGQAEGPMIGFASWGAGRVVAVPDHQMLNMGSYGEVSGVFYENGIRWLSGSDGLDVRLVVRDTATANWLAIQGYTDISLVSDAGLAASLSNADVLVAGWMGADPSEANLAAIGAFVRGGGGLFIADYGVGYQWWWNKPIHEAPGNRLLREAGLGFAGGHRWDTETLALSDPATGQLDAERLLEALADESSFDDEELDRAGTLFARIYDCLSPEDPLVRRLDAAFADRVDSISPTPATPVSDPWEQALLLRELGLLEATPPDEVVAHRSAGAVFGEIPDDAPRVSATVVIDPATTRWHSTGLYAAPGELVTIDAPASIVGAGFVLRINGHTDDLSDTGSWRRMPRVHRAFELDAEWVQVASPFGGAIYLDVGTAHQDMAPFEIGLSGVVDAPLFVLGETADADWVGGVRERPAPYAEIVTEHAALSLPSSMIRDLDEAEAVAAFWDEVVARQDEVGAHGHLRTNAERINIDVQVSVGYLHAGYPTQGPLGAGPELVDLEGLWQQGSWGWFHELGHEAQRRPDKSWGWDNAYTFDGAVEATVNIFTTYAYDMLGIEDRGGWSFTASRVAVMRRALDGLDSGGTFASLGVGVKLAMFLQLRDTWGWEAFVGLLAGYNATDAGELPADVQAERDALLVRFSEVVDHDMGPFMAEVWGIEVSAAARAQVAALPDWLPALGGLEGRAALAAGGERRFDLQGHALSHDGVATIGAVSDGAHGSVLPGEDGAWTYQAEPGFEGTDTFEYEVVSSTGHALISTIELEVKRRGVLMERWDGIEGNAIAALTSSAGFPDAPDRSMILDSFETPANAADQYGARLRGFLLPAAAGDYTFWIASDDHSELWLGDSADPDSAALIASVQGWTSPRQWDAYASQQSALVSLEQGRAYYVEALVKEGGGGDHLAVAWAASSGEPAIIDGAQVRVWRGANQAPIAGDDQAATTVDAPVVIDPLANDLDADGDQLYLRAWETSPGASVSAEEDGALIYTPPPGFVGDDTFTYTVADGYGGEATAQVVVSVLHDCDDLDCDDAEPCTDDACEPSLGCQHVAHDRACDDGDACTTMDHCEVGACEGTEPVSCEALDGCHVAGSCDPQTGTCDHPMVVDDTPCDDGDPLTGADGCLSGVCVGEPCACAAVSACCGGCFAMNEGGACDDGDACTTVDSCEAGACLGSAPVLCAALDGCHLAGACDPQTGACVHPLAPDDTPCDDGDPLTGDGHCVDGVCVAMGCDCAGLSPCCDGCFSLNEGGSCDDGDACTTVDYCQAGACQGTEPVLCEALDDCHVAGTCDPQTGACDDPLAADDTPCDDGDPGTSPDWCVEGFCVGQAIADVVEEEDTVAPPDVTPELDVEEEVDVEEENDVKGEIDPVDAVDPEVGVDLEPETDQVPEEDGAEAGGADSLSFDLAEVDTATPAQGGSTGGSGCTYGARSTGRRSATLAACALLLVLIRRVRYRRHQPGQNTP
jgi:hypothetical protein